jgi:S-formylglutathione hydrolase
MGLGTDIITCGTCADIPQNLICLEVMSGLTLLNRWKACGGYFSQYTHASTTTKTTMRFTVYLPPQAESKPVPVVYYLSGLTCTDENVVQKGFAQRAAAARGVALVAPDTR